MGLTIWHYQISMFAFDGITIDEYLVKKPSITELMPVVGDSMKDLGILDGDNVVVGQYRSYK